MIKGTTAVSYFITSFVFAVLTSCGGKQNTFGDVQHSRIDTITGFIPAHDSLKPLLVKSFSFDSLPEVQGGAPLLTKTNTNVKDLLSPDAFTVKVERSTSDVRPVLVRVKDSVFKAGQPDLMVAKDAFTKDQNSQNFSSYNKLQGLKHGNIRCLIEDQFGNIWMGTEGGGVSRFDGRNFLHITQEEGLSFNDVRCILQDSREHIWFGTNKGGLCKYDGKFFTYFKGVEALENGDILALEEDANGNIWIGTDGFGLMCLEVSGKTGDSLNLFQYGPEQGIESEIIWSIINASDGGVFVATEENGVYHFNQQFTNINREGGLPLNHIISLFKDQVGTIWCGTQGGGVLRFREDGLLAGSAEILVEQYNERHGLSNNVVVSITQEKSGAMWFGTVGGGANRIDFADTGLVKVTQFGIEEGLTNASLSSILEDRSGNVWMATYGGGICRYQGKLFTHFTVNEGLSSNNIWSMVSDTNGVVWFGSAGSGVVSYDGEQFKNYRVEHGLCSDDIRSMMRDDKGNIWFGSITSGISVFSPTTNEFTRFGIDAGLSGSDVRSMIQDQHGAIWIAVSGFGVTRIDDKSISVFNDENGLSGNDARCVYEDSQGYIWVATGGQGLTRISYNKEKKNGYDFLHFKSTSGFPDDFILCILEDDAGNIWFGTYGSGLVRMTPTADGYELLRFTEDEGLANNFVFSLLRDKDNTIWVGTRFGITVINSEKQQQIDEKFRNGTIGPKDVFCLNYGYDDGFLGIGCNGKAICQDDRGMIWIGTNDRLTGCHPDELKKLQLTDPPHVELTAIGLFNEKIDWNRINPQGDTVFTLQNGVSVGDLKFSETSHWYSIPQNLSLSHENNFLNFSFIGITLQQPKQVKYQFMLEGFDANWSAVTDRTEASYGNLPHGDYVFRVKAMNSVGQWSEEFFYPFSIRPPWWQTWWFRTTAAISLLLILYLLYYWRTASLRQRQRQLEKLVAERTATVVEQKQLIEVKHKEITDSINYAERIQRSFLATDHLMQQSLSSYFVFYLPKDVVSGDFYWASKLADGNFAFVTADSTGHGVPGAIMSILNITCLEKSVDENKLTDPGEILNQTRSYIIDRLKRDGSADGGKDGMDGTILVLDNQRKELRYAAANNPVWVVRNNHLIVLEPDHMPVAKHDKENIAFKSHMFSLQSGDMIYCLTDGFADQFGGPKGKKFMYRRLKEILLEFANLPVEQQRERLHNTFQTWKGQLEQVDDVCITGIRIA